MLFVREKIIPNGIIVTIWLTTPTSMFNLLLIIVVLVLTSGLCFLLLHCLLVSSASEPSVCPVKKEELPYKYPLDQTVDLLEGSGYFQSTIDGQEKDTMEAEEERLLRELGWNPDLVSNVQPLSEDEKLEWERKYSPELRRKRKLSFPRI